MNMTWHKTITKEKQNFLFLTNVKEFPNKKAQDESEDLIDLDSCMAEFKKPEQLDQDNMWYCPNCKDHV